MNCYQHPEVSATAFCRNCGRPLCPSCQFPAEGTVFCADHAPAAAYGPPPPAYAAAAPYGPASPYVTPVDPSIYPPGAAPNPYTSPTPPLPTAVHTSPGLAFLLGLIPGVGAIYNGQYVKGLLHAVIFGLLITLCDSAHGPADALFGMLIGAFYFYMPFEAYHTARKRQLGLPVDEWSSLIVVDRFGSRTAIGPALLIIFGVLFLLDSLNILSLSQLGRFWPVLLIVIGVAMLFARVSSGSRRSSSNVTGGFDER